MGSITDKAFEAEEKERIDKKIDKVNSIIQSIKGYITTEDEVKLDEMIWLFSNEEKIYKLKKVIDFI